jgi:hypothetical protein
MGITVLVSLILWDHMVRKGERRRGRGSDNVFLWWGGRGIVVYPFAGKESQAIFAVFDGESQR